MAQSKDPMAIEANILKALKQVYDPEIPVNIYDLGLIYEIDLNDDGLATIMMTLTAPNCPMADQLFQEVKQAVENVEGVNRAHVRLTFDPPWDRSMMSEEAMLELGFL